MISGATSRHRFSLFFFFNDTATTEIYTLSLHDALPIWLGGRQCQRRRGRGRGGGGTAGGAAGDAPGVLRLRQQRDQGEDRKSTRLNSRHLVISYAVFCLKKKKKT